MALRICWAAFCVRLMATLQTSFVSMHWSGGHRGLAAALILQLLHGVLVLDRLGLLDQLRERDAVEVIEDLVVERRPQVVREALAVAATILHAAALGGVDRLVHRA